MISELKRESNSKGYAGALWVEVFKLVEDTEDLIILLPIEKFQEVGISLSEGNSAIVYATNYPHSVIENPGSSVIWIPWDGSSGISNAVTALKISPNGNSVTCCISVKTIGT